MELTKARRMSARLISALAIASAAAFGCAPDSAATGEWAGTVYDSAGITVVANPERGIWTVETAWRLEEDLRIGVVEGDPMREFGSSAGLAVDGAGQMYVLDGMASEVRVFDAAGEFVNAFGRRGSGPGELNSPSAVLIGGGDTILDAGCWQWTGAAVPDRWFPGGPVPDSYGWRPAPPWVGKLQRLRPLPEDGRPHSAAPNGEMPPCSKIDAWPAVVSRRYRHELRRCRTADWSRVVAKPFERSALRDSDRRPLRERIRAHVRAGSSGRRLGTDDPHHGVRNSFSGVRSEVRRPSRDALGAAGASSFVI